MPIRDLKDAELSARLQAKDVVAKTVPQSARQGDEKRGSSDSRLDKFAEKIRPKSSKKPIVDRRRKRLTTADIDVPRRQFNICLLYTSDAADE